MKNIQRLLAVLLILLLFCGCSAPKDAEAPSSPQTPASAAADPSFTDTPTPAAQTEADAGTFHLEYQTLTLPAPLLSATALTVLDQAIVLGGFSETGLALAWLTPDGQSGELPLPGGAEYLYALCPDGTGGFWLLCGSLPKGYTDAFGNFAPLSQDPEGKLALAHYDASFTLQELVLLQSLYSVRFSQLCRTDGGFCLMSASLLVRLDEVGTETARQSLEAQDGWSFMAMQETDGVLYALARNIYGTELPELRSFTPDQLAPLESESCAPEAGGLGLYPDGRLLLADQETVFAQDPGSGKTETLVRWQEFGVSLTAEQLWSLDGGYLLYTPDDTALTYLRSVSGSAPVRTVLTLAIVSGDTPQQPFMQMLQDFNLSQSGYLIDWTVYTASEYADGQPIDLLRTQIIAGQSPDLFAFYTGGYNAVPLVPEDVCADLLPLLGSGFTADSLLPNLYALLTKDGPLCQLPLTMDVDTMLAPASLIPEPGVTLAGLEDARRRMPDGWVPIDSWNTPENLFALCTSYCIGAYADKAAGTCNFETQGFYDYLAWCKAWGGDGSTPDAPERTLVQLSWTNSLGQLAGRSKAAEEYWFGEPSYTYIGYPTADGSGGSGYRILTALGVSPQCRDLHGAKLFLEYCFSYLQEDALPANYDLLRSEMEAYIAGSRTDWFGEVTQISRADAEQFYALLDSITVLEGLDAPLSDILSEEANAYFSGGCTAEQAARAIQSRASVYLQEQYG